MGEITSHLDQSKLDLRVSDPRGYFISTAGRLAFGIKQIGSDPDNLAHLQFQGQFLQLRGEEMESLQGLKTYKMPENQSW